MDWRLIKNEKEKYAAYLCSREWGKKREEVRQRAGGDCERCRALPMDAVHHLTYERKYDEHLDDLQAICNGCHAFTHAKSDFDPCLATEWLRYLLACKKSDNKPIPLTWMINGGQPFDYKLPVIYAVKAIVQELFSHDPGDMRHDLMTIAVKLEEKYRCPYSASLWFVAGQPTTRHDFYCYSLELLGLTETKDENIVCFYW